MTFRSRVWYPIAAGLALLNLAGVAFAVMPGEPWHATAHAAAALAFGVWAQRLRDRRREDELEARLEPAEDLEELEDEMSLLRQELLEMQERLDFAERMLAQQPEARRVEPDRDRPRGPGETDRAE